MLTRAKGEDDGSSGRMWVSATGAIGARVSRDEGISFTQAFLMDGKIDGCKWDSRTRDGM